jgi:hypothetical protein
MEERIKGRGTSRKRRGKKEGRVVMAEFSIPIKPAATF